MRKFFGPKGSVSQVTIDSRALENNMLGDPSERVVDVYVPAGHDGTGCRYSLTLSASPAVACLTRIGSASARTCRSGSTG